MDETVDEKWLTPEGGLPLGNYPQHMKVRFVRADLIQQARAEAYAEALEAAKKEILSREVACADWFAATGDAPIVFEQLPLAAGDVRALPNPYLYNDGKGVG